MKQVPSMCSKTLYLHAICRKVKATQDIRSGNIFVVPEIYYEITQYLKLLNLILCYYFVVTCTKLVT